MKKKIISLLTVLILSIGLFSPLSVYASTHSVLKSSGGQFSLSGSSISVNVPTNQSLIVIKSHSEEPRESLGFSGTSSGHNISYYRKGDSKPSSVSINSNEMVDGLPIKYITLRVATEDNFHDSNFRMLGEIVILVGQSTTDPTPDPEPEPEPQPNIDYRWYFNELYEYIAGTNTRLNTVNTRLNTVNSKLDSLNANISISNEKLDTLYNGIKDMKTTLNNTLNTTNSRLNTINNSINSMNSNLSAKLDATNNHLNDIKGELRTTRLPKKNTTPDYSKELEKNKPKQNENTFVDNNKYFDSPENVQVDSNMPDVPDVKKWDDVDEEEELNQEKEFSKDIENEKNDEFNKDNEFTKDEFNKDEFNKDNEFTKDEFNKDEFNKDNEFTKDEFNKDEFNKDNELNKDNFNKDNEFNQTNKFKQELPMQLEEENYNLRWKSINGRFQ